MPAHTRGVFLLIAVLELWRVVGIQLVLKFHLAALQKQDLKGKCHQFNTCVQMERSAQLARRMDDRQEMVHHGYPGYGLELQEILFWVGTAGDHKFQFWRLGPCHVVLL